MGTNTLLGWGSKILLGVALACVIAATSFDFGGVMPFGILFAGGGLLTAAVYIYRTQDMTLMGLRRRTTFDEQQTPNTWVIVLGCVGASLVLLFVGLWLGLDKRIFSAAQRFSATTVGTELIWVAIGAGIVVWGVINFRTPAPQNNPLERLKEAPHQLAGVVLVLIGLMVVGVNLLKLFAPGTLDHLTNEFLSWLAL